MVVNIPVGGETKDTVEEITEGEVEDQEEYWIFCHGKLLTKRSPNSARKEIQIEEGGDGDDVTNSPNDSD